MASVVVHEDFLVTVVLKYIRMLYMLYCYMYGIQYAAISMSCVSWNEGKVHT